MSWTQYEGSGADGSGLASTAALLAHHTAKQANRPAAELRAAAPGALQRTPSVTYSMGQASNAMLDELLQRLASSNTREHAATAVAQDSAKPRRSLGAAVPRPATGEHATAAQVWHSSRVATDQLTIPSSICSSNQQKLVHCTSLPSKTGICSNPFSGGSAGSAVHAALAKPGPLSAYNYYAAKAEAGSTARSPAAARLLLGCSSSSGSPASSAVQQRSQQLPEPYQSRSHASNSLGSNSTGDSRDAGRAVKRSQSTPSSSGRPAELQGTQLDSSSSYRMRAGTVGAAAAAPAKQDGRTVCTTAEAMVALQALAAPRSACCLELALTGSQLRPLSWTAAAAGAEPQSQQQQQQQRLPRVGRITSALPSVEVCEHSSGGSEQISSRTLSRSSSRGNSSRVSRASSVSSSNSGSYSSSPAQRAHSMAAPGGAATQQSNSSRSSSRVAAMHIKVTVSFDPAVWLPQQHPAVSAALKADAAVFATSTVDNAEKQAAQLPLSAYAGQSSVNSPSALLSSSPHGGKKLQRNLQLLAPQFPAVPPTLLFLTGQQEQDSLLQLSIQRQQQQQQQQQPQEVFPLPSVKMHVRYCGVANNTVKQVFRASGFKVTKGGGWHVLWGSLAPTELLAGISPWQRHNHFPGTWELGRKDRLYRNIAAAARRTRNPAAYNFVPKFFILPADLEDFKLDLAQNPKTTYIRKPVASSRGRGVRVVADPHALDASSLSDVILQHYIPNPLLIGGRKFDLRVYVAVTCLDPLRVYVYRKGLVRFASEQYSSSKSSLKHATMHLTNYSINKKAPNVKQPSCSVSSGSSKQQQPAAAAVDDGVAATPLQLADSCDVDSDSDSAGDQCSSVGGASKWSFGQFAEHLQQQGLSWDAVWQQVCSIVAQTMIATEPALSAATRSAGGATLMRSCFEVFGFDVLLDTQLRAWLLEVNTCPALNADSPLDMTVKTSMVADLLGLVGVTPCDKQVYEQTQAASKQARLTGLPQQSAATAAARAGSGNSSHSKHSSQQSQQQKTPPPTAGSASCSRSRSEAAAAAAVAAARTVKDVEQLQLLAVPPRQLPDCIRETAAEWRRCCRQQHRWQRVVPDPDPAAAARQCALFETPRLSSALVVKYGLEVQVQQKE